MHCAWPLHTLRVNNGEIEVGPDSKKVLQVARVFIPVSGQSRRRVESCGEVAGRCVRTSLQTSKHRLQSSVT